MNKKPLQKLMKHRTSQKPKHITNNNYKMKKTILQQERNKIQKPKIQRKTNNIKSTTNHRPTQKKNSPNSKKKPQKNTTKTQAQHKPPYVMTISQ